MATSKFVSGIVENVGSTQITITEDKLRNILLKHVPRAIVPILTAKPRVVSVQKWRIDKNN